MHDEGKRIDATLLLDRLRSLHPVADVPLEIGEVPPDKKRNRRRFAGAERETGAYGSDVGFAVLR